MHQRQVQMLEGRDRTTTAIGSQPGYRGALEKEGQQFGAGEDACYQLAILEVVARQSRFVLDEHAIDFRHALVGIVDGLAFTQKDLGDVLQAKGGEAPGRRATRLDAIDKLVYRAAFHLKAFAASHDFPQCRGYFYSDRHGVPPCWFPGS